MSSVSALNSLLSSSILILWHRPEFHSPGGIRSILIGYRCDIGRELRHYRGQGAGDSMGKRRDYASEPDHRLDCDSDRRHESRQRRTEFEQRVGPLSARTVSSSNSNLVTASAASGSTLGSHDVVVNNLATTASWTSGVFASSSTSIACRQLHHHARKRRHSHHHHRRHRDPLRCCKRNQQRQPGRDRQRGH